MITTLGITILGCLVYIAIVVTGTANQTWKMYEKMFPEEEDKK